MAWPCNDNLVAQDMADWYESLPLLSWVTYGQTYGWVNIQYFKKFIKPSVYRSKVCFNEIVSDTSWLRVEGYLLRYRRDGGQIEIIECRICSCMKSQRLCHSGNQLSWLLALFNNTMKHDFGLKSRGLALATATWCVKETQAYHGAKNQKRMREKATSLHKKTWVLQQVQSMVDIEMRHCNVELR